MIYDNNGKPEHIRSLLYLSVLFLFAGYQCINFFVPNADMILAVRVLATGFYAGVLYVYGGDARQAFFSPTPKRSDFLVVGIWISFLSHFLQCLYSIIYRLSPSEWLLYSEVVSPIVLLSVVAAVLHVSAPGAVDGIVPRRNKIALGVSVGFAAVVVVGLLVSRPNLQPYIQDLKPYISDWWGTEGDRSDDPPTPENSPWRDWRQGSHSHSSWPAVP